MTTDVVGDPGGCVVSDTFSQSPHNGFGVDPVGGCGRSRTTFRVSPSSTHSPIQCAAAGSNVAVSPSRRRFVPSKLAVPVFCTHNGGTRHVLGRCARRLSDHPVPTGRARPNDRRDGCESARHDRPLHTLGRGHRRDIIDTALARWGALGVSDGCCSRRDDRAGAGAMMRPSRLKRRTVFRRFLFVRRFPIREAFRDAGSTRYRRARRGVAYARSAVCGGRARRRPNPCSCARVILAPVAGGRYCRSADDVAV